MCSFSFVKKQLPLSLQQRVIGATFHNREMCKSQFACLPRGAQIVQDVARRLPASWFAIDDDDVGWPAAYRDRLVKTDDGGKTGLPNAPFS